MATRTTKERFFHALSEDGPTFFSRLGFANTEPAVFWRKLGAVEHGCFFMPDPTPTHFSVEVGAYVPALESLTDYICGVHATTFIVSRPLGLLGKAQNGRIFYHFATVEELRGKLPQVYKDFMEQAEPWLADLVTVEDVAKEFYKWRIAPPAPGAMRPPDAFAWAQYGWLLKEAGRPLEAQPWLERALEQLKEPAFWMKGNALVPIGTRGARRIPQQSEEIRLAELLRKDLGIDSESNQ